jgi:hypothetical protein
VFPCTYGHQSGVPELGVGYRSNPKYNRKKMSVHRHERVICNKLHTTNIYLMLLMKGNQQTNTIE